MSACGEHVLDHMCSVPEAGDVIQHVRWEPLSGNAGAPATACASYREPPGRLRLEHTCWFVGCSWFEANIGTVGNAVAAWPATPFYTSPAPTA